MQGTGTEQDDELSFQDFKRQLLQLKLFLRSIFRLAGRSIKRYYIVLILLLAVFAAWGHYDYKNSKVFEARASYVYVELQKKTYGEMIDKLQDMIKSKSYSQLARTLNINPQQAGSIISINGENVFGSRLSEDITEEKQLFYIRVMAANNKVYDTLQYALEHYLNDNLYVKATVARKTKILKQKITYGQQELAMLDSLKLAYTKSMDKPASLANPSASPFNPVLLYEKSEKINQELADMKTLLDDYRAVMTQDKFLVTEEPKQKSPVFFALRYFALYGVAGVLLIFILSIFKK